MRHFDSKPKNLYRHNLQGKIPVATGQFNTGSTFDSEVKQLGEHEEYLSLNKIKLKK